MADSPTILKEFLVALGYHVEPASFKSFVDKMDLVDKKAAKVGASVAGIAVAAEAMVGEFAHQMENLYFVSQRTGASVANIRELQFGARNIGLTAEQATSSLEGFANALRFNPGTRGLFQALTGATPGGDNQQNLLKLLERLHQLPQYIGVQFAAQFGMGQQEFLQYMLNLPEMEQDIQRAADTFARMGVDQQAAAEAGHEYMVTLRQIGLEAEALGGKLAVALLPNFKQAAEYADRILVALSHPENTDLSLKNIGAVAKEVAGDVNAALSTGQPGANKNASRGSGKPSTGPSFLDRLGALLPPGAGPRAGHGLNPRVSTGTIGGAGGAPVGPSVAPTKAQLEAMADAAAVANGLPPGVFRALIGHESSWNPFADAHKTLPNSNSRAFGLTQLEPGTAAGEGVDAHDVEGNLQGGASYLAKMLRRFGNMRAALGHYHGHGHHGLDASDYAYADQILNASGGAGGGDITQTNNITIAINNDADGRKTANAVSAQVTRQLADVVRNNASRVQ